MGTELSVNETVAADPRPPLANDAGSSPVPDPQARLLKRLLDMADAYRAKGNVHQAVELYFALVESYPSTAQVRPALARLMDIADVFDAAGERHHARSLYERLLHDES